MKTIVGTIVHFYDATIAAGVAGGCGYAGQGMGPYAAIVTGVAVGRPAGFHLSVVVPGRIDPIVALDVDHYDVAKTAAANGEEPSRYWIETPEA